MDLQTIPDKSSLQDAQVMLQFYVIAWECYQLDSTCLVADSSVQYLQPYYHALDYWNPPPDDEEERKAGRKRRARLPFVWLLIYRHLSGSGCHPRPFDHGLAANLNLFLYATKPHAHQAEFRPAQASTNRSRNPLLHV